MIHQYQENYSLQSMLYEVQADLWAVYWPVCWSTHCSCYMQHIQLGGGGGGGARSGGAGRGVALTPP